MEYRRFDDHIAVRLDKGEEICARLLEIAEKEQIGAAAISGIGAVSDFVVGLYDPEKKRFGENHFTGYYEVTAITGSLTTKDGAPYLHLHMSCADARGRVFGGHLARATISLTGEIFIRVLNGSIGRAFDEETGLNTFAF